MSSNSMSSVNYLHPMLRQLFKVITNKPLRLGFLLILAILPLVWKMLYVDTYVFEHTGTELLGALQVISNDSVIYAIILLLFYLSYINKVPQLASVLLRELAILVYLVYVIDFFVITNFSNHLFFGDISRYAPYSYSYLQQIYGIKIFLFLLLFVFALAYITPCITSKFKIVNYAPHRNSIILIIALFFVPYLNAASNNTYVHSWVYRNVISHNLMLKSEAKQFSDDFRSQFRYQENLPLCSPNEIQNPNIILLMVESLSSYQSNFFSGIKDWTPELDAIASNNTAFKNFYANGFTTEDGEISLLTGLLPIYPPASYTSGGGSAFNGFYNIENSLPELLNSRGYSTEFLSTADLSFANTKPWARNIGFSYIEGHEHPYYNNWDRFQFDSAPDEALYTRVLERTRINADNNYFIFIKTVSTHHPFVNPENNKQSEAEAFQYADRQIGAFYRQLIEEDFFDNGLLIIVGDHHAMIPLKKEEIQRYGAADAAAKVPLIIVSGATMPLIENTRYQQTDVFNSLNNLVSNTQCTNDWQGDVFSHTPAKYVAHRRGDNRNIISVFTDEEYYSVKLDGDNTRLSNDSDSSASEEINNAIINKINALRL